MDVIKRLTERPGRLQDCNAMLISALCNLSVLVALGLLAAAADEDWGGMTLTIHPGEGDSPIPDDSLLQDSLKLKVAAAPAAPLGPERLFDVAAVPTTDAAALDALAANSMPASGMDGLALDGTAYQKGAAGMAATEFFGIGGYGQTFVYIVDASGSMNENGKFDRARYELLQSIEQLASDQRYFIIFFNDRAYPMNADEPVFATEEQLARTARWVQGATADNGTNPLPALLLALSLRPDAIYFLSDGQFHPLAVHQVRLQNRPSRRMQRRQIPIHTISFVDRSTVGLMRSIARNSGGEHRFVK